MLKLIVILFVFSEGKNLFSV